jgi:hypothetical protein
MELLTRQPTMRRAKTSITKARKFTLWQHGIFFTATSLHANLHHYSPPLLCSVQWGSSIDCRSNAQD